MLNRASWAPLRLWPALIVCRLLGALWAVGGGFLLYSLHELRGPEWILGTVKWSGGAIGIAAALMLLAAWVRRGSATALLATALIGFFGAMPLVALAAGRLVPSFALDERTVVLFDWQIPPGYYWLGAALSLLLSICSLMPLLPARRRAPQGFGPILPET